MNPLSKLSQTQSGKPRRGSGLFCCVSTSAESVNSADSLESQSAENLVDQDQKIQNSSGNPLERTTTIQSDATIYYNAESYFDKKDEITANTANSEAGMIIARMITAQSMHEGHELGLEKKHSNPNPIQCGGDNLADYFNSSSADEAMLEREKSDSLSAEGIELYERLNNINNLDKGICSLDQLLNTPRNIRTMTKPTLEDLNILDDAIKIFKSAVNIEDNPNAVENTYTPQPIVYKDEHGNSVNGLVKLKFLPYIKGNYTASSGNKLKKTSSYPKPNSNMRFSLTEIPTIPFPPEIVFITLAHMRTRERLFQGSDWRQTSGNWKNGTVGARLFLIGGILTPELSQWNVGKAEYGEYPYKFLFRESKDGGLPKNKGKWSMSLKGELLVLGYNIDRTEDGDTDLSFVTATNMPLRFCILGVQEWLTCLGPAFTQLEQDIKDEVTEGKWENYEEALRGWMKKIDEN